MKRTFVTCLLLGLAAKGMLELFIVPQMGWLAGWFFALAVTALALYLYLLLTRDAPMAGPRGRLFTYLWNLLAPMQMVESGGDLWGLLSIVLVAVQVAAALRLDRKHVRCPRCGKRLPYFGDMNLCHACGTRLPL